MTLIDTTPIFAEFWGDIIYYRLRYRDHLNQVCEEWQRYQFGITGMKTPKNGKMLGPDFVLEG